MEIYNYNYGVKFRNPAAGEYTALNTFYAKNTARVTHFANLQFLINDPPHYQHDLTFVRTNVTLINSLGVVVPVPATDDELFDLLAAYLNSDTEPVVGNIVPITGANYILTAADNGRTFLAYEPPSAKTFTITAGLPIGLKAYVIKMYATSAITFVGAGGMAFTGLDLLLDKLGSRMDILITGPATAVLLNIGG